MLPPSINRYNHSTRDPRPNQLTPRCPLVQITLRWLHEAGCSPVEILVLVLQMTMTEVVIGAPDGRRDTQVTINLDRIDDGARITLTYDLRGRDTDNDGEADADCFSDYSGR